MNAMAKRRVMVLPQVMKGLGVLTLDLSRFFVTKVSLLGPYITLFKALSYLLFGSVKNIIF